ncbi:MAG: patatin-like phospholipase family protein [Anaerolineaceae bacterium]|nr:patatin-like phospholipase family protein [Anaerolineaceae bacterium]
MMSFERNPYFWALVSMGALFIRTTSTSLLKKRVRLLIDGSSVILFIVSQLMLVSPLTESSRMALGMWRLVPGVALLAVSIAQMITASVFFMGLFAPKKQTAYIQMLWRTGGIFSMIRYPLLLAELLFTLGIVLIFNSLAGLILQPIWWAAFLVLLTQEAKQLRKDLGGYYPDYRRRMFSYLNPSKAMKYVKNLPEYPFRNLVFKGGGARGMAYIGSMRALDEKGILPQVERVAGTSAGAIVAVLASLRVDYNQWAPMLREFDISTVMNRNERSVKLHNLWRLESDYGLFSSESFYEWLQEVIAASCEGNGLATFADFRERGHLDLSIVASNLNLKRDEIFSYDTSPDMPVADAVRMSISIPLYFSALQHDGQGFGEGDFYVDGGVFNNFPIHLFDAPKYGRSNPWYINRINYETLGFYLYPNENRANQKHVQPKNFFEYLMMILESFRQAQQVQAFTASTTDQRRSVKIDDCGISSVNFAAVQPSPEFDCLLQSGYECTMAFLEEYQPPIDR